MTAKLENVNKFSKLGLRRRPTYEEIIGLLDENEKLGQPLPNRDATFFRNSNEGSFFDGVEQMEALKDEQQRLLLRQMSEVLLRQNVRTAGRTFHVERSRQLPLQSPSIIPQEPMNIDEEGGEQPAQQRGAGQSHPTQAPPSTRLQQASQLNAELSQRGNRAMKRKEETVVNHRGEMFKQNKPTLAEQMLNIQPPRAFPEVISIATSDDDISDPTATSSNQPMKRDNPETEIEPKGKRGRPAHSGASASRPKMVQEGTKRATPAIITVETKGKDGRPRLKTGKGEKRDGDVEPEEEIPNRAKRTNKTKEKQQMRLEASLKKAEAEAEAENESKPEPTKKGRGVKKDKMKREPLEPKSIPIQELRNEFVDALNKKMITNDEYNEFQDIFNEWKKARGNAKTKHRNKARLHYGKVLYNKLKKKYEDDDL